MESCVLAVSGGGAGLQDVQTHLSNVRACIRRASSRTEIEPHLGAGRPFVWALKRRSVCLRLLDWRCPLSKRCFSCQHLNKWELICISLIPPPLPAPPEELYLLSPFSESPRCFMPLFLRSRMTLAVLTEWLIDMCFLSLQVWSAWLKRHDLDPWWAYGLKALTDCLAIPPTLIESLMCTHRILIKTRGYRPLGQTI